MRIRRVTIITVVVTAATSFAAVAAAAPGATGDDRKQRVAPGPPVNFVSVCNFSHAVDDDPIVFPGEPGASHLHHFFGNTSTDADSTQDTLAEAGTTCSRLEDLSGYWVPALHDNGVEQRPGRAQAYYTLAGKDPDSVVAFPADLRVIAGGTDAPAQATRWGCHDPDTAEPLVTTTAVPACAEGEHLAARVVFPDCWDGVSTDSADHRSHLDYSRRGECPDSHPVALPRLRLTVSYPDADGGDDVSVASGAPETMHADFLNAWDPQELERLVEDCLAAEERCGIIGGPGSRF